MVFQRQMGLADGPLDSCRLVIVLGRRQPLSDLAHATRHANRLHQALLVWDQSLNLIERASDVIKQAGQLENFIASRAF